MRVAFAGASQRAKSLDVFLSRWQPQSWKLGKSRRHMSNVFEVGDRVLLRREDRSPKLTAPLTPGGWTNANASRYSHDKLIGARPRDVVLDEDGKRQLRVTYPTLAEYIVLHPRKVTPIYPADGELIVNLLDIHSETPTVDDETLQYEIFEAGTGHGALTLLMARAIHGANALAHAKYKAIEGVEGADAAFQAPEWRKLRRAIVHTVDVSATYSDFAQKIVQGFRRGMYSPDIEFRTSDASAWLADQMQIRGIKEAEGQEGFLTHVILDCPGAMAHFRLAAQALRVNGTLLAFFPSITQILDLVRHVKLQRLPLQLEKVVEVGHSMTGGRDWRVESVRRKRSERPANVSELREEPSPLASAEDASSSVEVFSEDDTVTNAYASDQAQSDATVSEKNDYSDLDADVIVCRPRVGEMIVGGGFVGLWKRKSS